MAKFGGPTFTLADTATLTILIIIHERDRNIIGNLVTFHQWPNKSLTVEPRLVAVAIATAAAISSYSLPLQ